MSNKKSGLSPKQREDVLRGYGFAPARKAKGSHMIWEHQDLKMLMRSRKIEIEGLPTALDSTKKPWEMTVCDNPAPGTWDVMKKQGIACQRAVEKAVGQSSHEQQRLDVARQFRKAVGEYNQWKKDIGNWAKAGLNMADAPAAPMSFRELTGLKAEKNRLSTPAP